MKVAEKATPVAAVFAALATLACCMPLGLLGAVGLAGFTLWAAKYRVGFLGLAWILLIIGAVQIYRGRRSCRTKSRGSVITFWVALALVLFIFLFPQVIANVLAGLS
jgi:hypothetical protein